MDRCTNYLKGYVKIRILGYKPQRFVNICLRRKIPLWDLTQVSENEFTLCMSIKDFKTNAKSVKNKANVKIHILEKSGMIFKLKKYKHRKLLLILSVVMIIFFAYINSCVWNINISGADVKSQVSTMHLMNEFGIKKGTFMRNIDTKNLAQKLLNAQDNLSWVGVKKKGTTLNIEIVQATFYKGKKGDLVPRSEPCDVAVSKDCLLYKVTVEEGIQRVKTGNTVVAGDRVIIGGDKHATGEILGCVWYKVEVPVENVINELVYTNNFRERKSFILFGLKMDIPNLKFKKENFEYYNSEYSEKYLGVNKKLPFGIGTLIERETIFKERILSKEEAKIYAINKAQSILDNLIPRDGKILRTVEEFKNSDNNLRYILSVEVLENVGIDVTCDLN